MRPGDTHAVDATAGVIAVDGERELTFEPGQRPEVRLRGRRPPLRGRSRRARRQRPPRPAAAGPPPCWVSRPGHMPPTSPSTLRRTHDRHAGTHGADQGAAAERLPDDADHPRVRGAGARRVRHAATSPASCTSMPARRPRRSASAATSATADCIASTHRGHGHCIAKGVRRGRHDGRDLRPAGRAVRRQGRLDAHRRPVQGHAGRQRHRRRRPAAGLRRGAGRQDAAAPATVGGGVRRRRRLQPGHHASRR